MSECRVDVSDVPSPFSFWNKVARLFWGWVWLLLFRPSPRPFHGWRRMLLRLFGAGIGKGVHLYPSCVITMPWKLEMGEHSCLGDHVICYNIGGVRIGAHSTVSQYSHLCSSSHDFAQPTMPQTFAAVVVEDQAWICADVFLGPGVTIGQGSVVAGNPARFVKKRELRETA